MGTKYLNGKNQGGWFGGLTAALRTEGKINAYIMRTDPLNNLQNNSALPNVNGKRLYVTPTSAGSLYNGHSMDNMLKEFGINSDKYKKNKMKNKIILCILLLSTIACNKITRDRKVDKGRLLGKDYRLFQETAAWELAKAVWDNDVDKIDEEVKKNPEILNYQEKTYGNILLHLSIYNDNYKGFKELLKLGADPNISDSMHCSSPLITACENFDNRTEYVEELIKYNADVNYVECSSGKEEQKTNRTPLIYSSIRGNINTVKLLIENGAKINYVSPNGEYALSAALSHYDIVLYLLEKGADCSKVLYKKDSGDSLRSVYMRDWIETEANRSAKEYSKIVALLKKKGCL
ncbi:ankyrin repeat domain-containing protein [Chryseobacterium sp. WG14]|uniref:ankyrin repeat domain-containing protein n=1 Tax=Chryseobacterium sp. WG14 TaxID=2926909 RepID=UPI00211DFE1B|nr:ankyrin repeat domain-containing protein [Chryseobacterium sp. WG14]MCQ9641431.1 ankyrin repeat domain-containing protein [Chryseobacterium sp. WG14]